MGSSRMGTGVGRRPGEKEHRVCGQLSGCHSPEGRRSASQEAGEVQACRMKGGCGGCESREGVLYFLGDGEGMLSAQNWQVG